MPSLSNQPLFQDLLTPFQLLLILEEAISANLLYK